MSDHVEQTISLVQEQVANLEKELIEKRRMVNSLCALVKRPPIYPDEVLQASGTLPVRSDEYYGQPLATAIRMVLTRRKLSNLGPASVNEIYDALIAGGYKFGAKTEDYAKRGLYTALTKNSSTFHKLPQGDYGLLEWYPNAKEARSTKAGNGDSDTVPESEEEMAEKEATADAEAADQVESDERADKTKASK